MMARSLIFWLSEHDSHRINGAEHPSNRAALMFKKQGLL
jgi:hypothetical protein